MYRKTKCVEIMRNPWIPVLTSQGFGFISGASGFPAPFCCWLRSLDGDWELIPLNLMEKPGKKPLSSANSFSASQQEKSNQFAKSPHGSCREEVLTLLEYPVEPSQCLLHPTPFFPSLPSCFPSRQQSLFWVWIILLLVPFPSSYLHFLDLFPVSPGGFCSFSPQKFP